MKSRSSVPKSRTRSSALGLTSSRFGAYDGYKAATRKFRDDLSRLIPFRLVSVSDLAKAVDHIATEHSLRNQGIKTSRVDFTTLLENLEETISLREAVGKTYKQDANDGHGYILQVLKYCRFALQKTQQEARIRKFQRARSKQSYSHQSYLPPDGKDNKKRAAHPSLQCEISNGDDYENESDDGSSVEDQDIQDVAEPIESAKIGLISSPATRYSIDNDLINGSLSFQANLFFLEAEKLFSTVADAYEALHEKLDDSINPPSHHESVVYLLQASTTVNLALESVDHLEKSFLLECPQFHSIYHIFAVLIFQKQISDMEAIMYQYDPEILSRDPERCYNLVADMVRIGFAGRKSYFRAIGQFNKRASLDDKSLNSKLKKLQDIDESTIQINIARKRYNDIALGISRSTLLECTMSPAMRDQIPQGEGQWFQFCDFDGHDDDDTVAFSTATVERVSWLENYRHLGGTNGILSAFSRMQCWHDFWDNFERRGKCWEAEKDEDVTTDQILDGILFLDLLPFLKELKDRDLVAAIEDRIDPDLIFKCMPTWKLLESTLPEWPKSRAKDQSTYINFATAFGVHALVFGLRILRRHKERLAVLSRLTVGKFEAQLNDISDSPFMKRVFNKDSNVEYCLYVLREVVSMQSYNWQQHMRRFTAAFWNPQFAGSFLTFVTFVSNMLVGDTRTGGHLTRIVLLHLYNALKARKIVEKIEILEVLDRVFANEDTWQLEKPTKSEFLKCFCFAVGDSLRVIDRYTQFLQIKDSDQIRIQAALREDSSKIMMSIGHLTDVERSVVERVYHLSILKFGHYHSFFYKQQTPETISPSYASFISAINSVSSGSGTITDLGESCRRVSSILSDKIHADHEILSLNWLKISYHADDFHSKLMESLGVSHLIPVCRSVLFDQMKMKNDIVADYHITYKFLLDKVFRELEFEEDPNLCHNSKIAARLMSEYFTKTANMKNSTFF